MAETEQLIDQLPNEVLFMIFRYCYRFKQHQYVSYHSSFSDGWLVPHYMSTQLTQLPSPRKILHHITSLQALVRACKFRYLMETAGQQALEVSVGKASILRPGIEKTLTDA